ncbi:MAG: hypothetical protein AB1942_12815 [Pseudomonadota bacterium]
MAEGAAQRSVLGNAADMAQWLAGLAVDPSVYEVWAKVFLIGAAPTALLALPIFLRTYEKGVLPGLRMLAWTCVPALVLLIASPLVGQFFSRPGDGSAFAILFLGVCGFTLMLWLPIAGATALIGAWRRRIALERRG